MALIAATETRMAMSAYSIAVCPSSLRTSFARFWCEWGAGWQPKGPPPGAMALAREGEVVHRIHGVLDDTAATQVIRKQVKQRQDSIGERGGDNSGERRSHGRPHN